MGGDGMEREEREEMRRSRWAGYHSNGALLCGLAVEEIITEFSSEDEALGSTKQFGKLPGRTRPLR